MEFNDLNFFENSDRGVQISVTSVVSAISAGNIEAFKNLYIAL